MEPNDALLASVESILDDEELSAASRGVALIDTVTQYIVYTGADRAPQPGAPLAATMFGRQSPDVRVTATAKAAIGEKAEELRKAHPLMTIEKARAAVISNPDNRDLVRRYNEEARAAVVAKAAPAHGPALTALHKRADKLVASEGLSRHRAVAKIAESREPQDRALWRAARAEEASRAA